MASPALSSLVPSPSPGGTASAAAEPICVAPTQLLHLHLHLHLPLLRWWPRLALAQAAALRPEPRPIESSHHARAGAPQLPTTRALAAAPSSPVAPGSGSPSTCPDGAAIGSPHHPIGLDAVALGKGGGVHGTRFGESEGPRVGGRCLRGSTLGGADLPPDALEEEASELVGVLREGNSGGCVRKRERGATRSASQKAICCEQGGTDWCSLFALSTLFAPAAGILRMRA